jgi:hypothetical protein
MARLTPAQRTLLEHLAQLDPEDFHAAGDLDLPGIKNPGTALSRLAIRCLVQPEGTDVKSKKYRITGMGRKALLQ